MAYSGSPRSVRADPGPGQRAQCTKYMFTKSKSTDRSLLQLHLAIIHDILTTWMKISIRRHSHSIKCSTARYALSLPLYHSTHPTTRHTPPDYNPSPPHPASFPRFMKDTARILPNAGRNSGGGGEGVTEISFNASSRATVSMGLLNTRSAP